ncbi:hypothetical protein MN116_003862 [Schistosoma mekongi]|uniref:Uncharacterized protein n=1 Tax=Schistosoma mekongi TaxID=38744 RepID=A0AAE1ZG09_SCHME|nr:hypothetical protein MN116_003862 [Schistosoma mekongi]
MKSSLMILQNYEQNAIIQKIIFLFVFLTFLILCLLRTNNYICINTWLMFTPFWLWNIIVFTGLFILFLYKSFTITKFSLFYCLYQILLFTSQIFICIKLEENMLSWCSVFIPIYGLCILGFFTFTKEFCKLTLCDCEKFLALNIPSIILTGLRLDDYINWTWILVLIPFWITMGLIIALLLLLICMLCGLNRLTQKDLHDIIFIIGCLSIAFTFLTFVILLVCQLDKIKLFTYTEIFLPLIICIIFMLILTIFTEWLMNKVFGNTNNPNERNCTMEYITGSRSLRTASHGMSSDFHKDSTGRIPPGSFENNVGTVVSFNTNANNSNLSDEKMHFLYSNKLNQPIINENSISLPD